MIFAFLFLVVALFTAFVLAFIDNDGYGKMPAFKHPPRSHEADLFEPRTLV